MIKFICVIGYHIRKNGIMQRDSKTVILSTNHFTILYYTIDAVHCVSMFLARERLGFVFGGDSSPL